jgi:hypothetical protein
MKIETEFKEAILAMPEKEKDKLLIRLIKKDKVLVNQLYFQLLETKSVEAFRSELEERFQTESFSKYILRVLNPDVSDETIKSGLTGDVGGIVFRFYDENDENSKANAFLAKLIDPIFIEASGDNVESEKNQTENTAGRQRN